MEYVKLTDAEQKWYYELFKMCDVENTNKLPAVYVSELLSSAALSGELLSQILQLCGINRSGFVTRSQFYAALKLTAAAQNGVTLKTDLLSSAVEFPLPRLTFQGFSSDHWRSQQSTVVHSRSSDQSHLAHSVKSVPVIQQLANQITSNKPVVNLQLCKSSDSQDKDGLGSDTLHKAAVQNSSYIEYQDGEQRMDKGWASFEDDNQGLLSSEPKEWMQFVDLGKTDATSVTSSDTESVDDVWTITNEQREYYVTQFKTLQSDVRGVISGSLAKEFFEKSKLPVQELSQIWNLSDVNRDGALSLDEFCTAMHLVVLRRNDVELPDSLPQSLMPYVSLVNSDEGFVGDVQPGGTLKKSSPSSSVSSQWNPASHLPDSPTSSSVSSPGAKPTPVNFEFKPVSVDVDCKIIHPVAMRMSPDSKPYSTTTAYTDAGSYVGSTDHCDPSDQTSSVTDLIDLSSIDSSQQPVVGRPRPTAPKKTRSMPGSAVDGTAKTSVLAPPPASQETTASDWPINVGMSTSLVEEAPPPPPRGAHVHSRSSSLDNHLIDLSTTDQNTTSVPMVPPRRSPKDISKPELFGDGDYSTSRKMSLDSPVGFGMEQPETKITTQTNVTKYNSLEKKDLQASIRFQRERNLVLSRLNNELNQELQEVMEQRIALEIQLEHLRPLNS